MIEKPIKKDNLPYDFNDCVNFIQAKHEINIRDYAGKFTSDESEGIPYQDFWHFFCDKATVSNGCLVVMSEWWFNDAEEWQVAIGNLFFEEFGEVDDNGETFIDFYVWW